jgi:hypothetical protein
MPTLTLTWTDESGTGVGLATDLVHGCIISDFDKEVIPIPLGATREDEEVAIPLPTHWHAENTLHCYIAFKRADGLDVSDTQYLEKGW